MHTRMNKDDFVDDIPKESVVRKEYFELFPTRQDAQAFEAQALSADRKYIPDCVHFVRNGADPTAEYWIWLANQKFAADEDE